MFHLKSLPLHSQFGRIGLGFEPQADHEKQKKNQANP